jgi:cytochrome P450
VNAAMTPFVRGYPLVGVVPHLARDMLGFMTALRDQHGDVVRAHLGRRTGVFVADPIIIEHVLVENTRNYTKQTKGYGVLRKLMGNGLLTSEGSFWLRQRRIAQPAFHRERIAGFAAVMQRDAAQAIASWPKGRPFDVAHELMRLTMRIVGETLFSSDVTREANNIGAAITELLQQAMTRTRSLFQWPDAVPTPLNVRFQRATRVLDREILRIIEDRRRGDDKPDLLSMLMNAVDEETGERMSDAQLRDEAMTLFLAGHETTANNLAWTLYLLSQHPEIEQALRAEVKGADDVMGLPLLEAVLKESLRLFPPAWLLARRCESDEVLQGHPVRRDEFVFISQWAVHRHPKLWAEPTRFDPRRFLETPEPTPRYAYFPFSGGARKCIGDFFALMEGKIILAEILRRTRLTLAADARVEPQPVVTLRPRYGLPMVRSDD